MSHEANASMDRGRSPLEFRVGDTQAAVAFLQCFAPEGPWTLSTDAGGRFTTQSFGLGNTSEMFRWIEQLQGKANIYFSINTPRRLLSKKADKFDIGRVVALYVDIDPVGSADTFKDERAHILQNLRAYKFPPTVILSSGGGYWGIWLLDSPIDIEMPTPGALRAKTAIKARENSNPQDKAEYDSYLARVSELEAFNKALEREFNADNCGNVDRVARLPGTINVPNKRKVAKGRQPALATIVEVDWNRRYPLTDFTPEAQNAETMPRARAPATADPEGPIAQAPAKANPEGIKVDGLPADLPDWCLRVIEYGDDPAAPGRYGGDRSRALLAVVCELVRKNCEPATILGVIMDRANGINAHVRRQPQPLAYAKRQIDRASQMVAVERSDFKGTKDGTSIAKSQQNIRMALSKLGIMLSYDEFAGRQLIEGPDGAALRHFDEAELERQYLAVDEKFGFRPSLDFFAMVVRNEAHRNRFHPVRNYLDPLTWDGEPRLAQWLVAYGGAEDSEYVRSVGRIVLIAAVRRIRQPGCKFDEMLVLESVQGQNKSSALRVLAINEDWFSDDLPLNCDEKKVIETLSGRLIVEAAELNGMRKGETEHLKSLMSRQIDRSRMSYDRLVTEVPRQSIIIGTTNSAQYLRDSTGNRRFWPVRIKQFDLEALRRDRDQLWAEAAHAEAADESIRLDPSLYSAAAEQQQERLVSEPWVDLVASELGNQNGKIAAADLWALVNIREGMWRPDLGRVDKGDSQRG